MSYRAIIPGFVVPEKQQRFDASGYEVVSLFSPPDLEYLRAGYERLPREGERGFHATMYSENAEYRQAVYEFIAPLVVERLRGLLGGYDLRVANWVVKEAGHVDSSVSFHQDWSFVDERRYRSIHLWFPLIDVDQQNGCLEVVGGSHMVSADHRSHSDKCRFDDLGPALRAKYAIPVPLRAGQGIMYDGALLHTSAHNRSLNRRIAVGTVLVPKDAELLHAYRNSPTTVEVFSVDDSFFWRHQPGTRPLGASMIGIMESSTLQHGEEALRAMVVR